MTSQGCPNKPQRDPKTASKEVLRTQLTLHQDIYTNTYSSFVGARRLSRSDWDPARAHREAKAQSAVSKQTLAWSRLGRKRSFASLIGGAEGDECENTVNYNEFEGNRAPVQALY